MTFKGNFILIFLTTATVTIPGGFGNESQIPTRTNIFSSLLQQFQGQATSFNPSANPIPQTLPFQLLPTAGQFGTFFALINNFTQSSKEPQSEQDQTIDETLPKFQSRSGPSSPIYTTLPFYGLNLTEFPWLAEGPNANGSSLQTTKLDREEDKERFPQQKLFGRGNTTYADLNLLTVPQLFNLIGR